MAAIAWETGGGEVTTVMVWTTPAARGDFALERMMPLYESGTLGEEHGHPERVTAVNVYVSPSHGTLSRSRGIHTTLCRLLPALSSRVWKAVATYLGTQ